MAWVAGLAGLANDRTPATEPVIFHLCRNAAIKSFELSLETIGKLSRKALEACVGNPRSVDALAGPPCQPQQQGA